MNRPLVDKIVHAVLYEGYMLYPYRPSVKNTQRWTFGGLYPRTYSDAQAGTDAWSMQTECLVRGSVQISVRVRVRFLHLMDRRVGEVEPSNNGFPESQEPSYRMVESLRVGDTLLHAWQEAVEREIVLDSLVLSELQSKAVRREFTFPATRQLDTIRGTHDEVAGIVLRRQSEIQGLVEVSAGVIDGDLWKLHISIQNLTPAHDDLLDRDTALMHALVSTHTIVEAQNGEFISLLDPGDAAREYAADCQNIGAFPVLVGDDGTRDTMLSSPIILYDYPQIAPESPGDLFDSTEIDEILILRILTLTDAEKEAAAAIDERVRALLCRNESLALEQLRGLHGAIRGLQTVKGS